VNGGVHHIPAEQTQQDRFTQLRHNVTRFPVTYSLIGVTVVVFIFQWLIAFIVGRGIVCGSDDLLCQIGAKVNQAIIEGQVWRFISPIFIHVDPLHILVNMYSLNAVGPTVERFFGKERTAIIYILSGISGVAFSLAFNPMNSAGASGAIFGMVGAFAVFLVLHRDLFGSATKDLLIRITFVVLLNLALGFSAMVDNWGHVGGLLGGILVGGIIGPRWKIIQLVDQPVRVVDKRAWKKVRINSLFALGIITLICLTAIFNPIGQ
jgi:rhomboid protease GluP